MAALPRSVPPPAAPSLAVLASTVLACTVLSPAALMPVDLARAPALISTCAFCLANIVGWACRRWRRNGDRSLSQPRHPHTTATSQSAANVSRRQLAIHARRPLVSTAHDVAASAFTAGPREAAAAERRAGTAALRGATAPACPGWQRLGAKRCWHDYRRV